MQAKGTQQLRGGSGQVFRSRLLKKSCLHALLYHLTRWEKTSRSECRIGGSRYHRSGDSPATQDPPPQPPLVCRRGQTYFSKRKAQRIVRKETQSTTIQIMRYVLLGCKGAMSQAVITVLVAPHSPPCQQVSAGSRCHSSTAWDKAHPAGSCRMGPTTLCCTKACGRWRFHLPAARWGVASPSAPGRRW